MHGLDAVGIARQFGIDLASIPEPSGRIEINKLDALLGAVIPLIHDPAFGLKAARCWHPSNLGVLGHAWITSSTLRTGLNRLVRYHKILGERGTLEIEETPGGIAIRVFPNRENQEVAAVVADVVMSIFLDMCRMNAGADLRPSLVSLKREPPESDEAYVHFFGCPVQFGANENAFVLSREDADRLLPSSNRQLATMFDRMLTEEISRLDKTDIVARCKAALLENLSSGEVSEEDTAKHLHMSPRTLQRKLALAGLTYMQLVDEIRKDIALRYINDPRYSITDITFMLGFSYPSAFTRAYKRWTGETPSMSRGQP
jgi:AraC-like DNA-binding protein